MMLLLLAMGGRAWAGGKPPIAILGLEVYDSGSGIDPETTGAAKELTAALRDRARAGTGPFVLGPGERELIDEKLLNNCDSEAAPCMAAIGNQLGAEALMYGKIEKPTQAKPPVYRVSIKLLNVSRKQLVSSIVETIPLSEATGVRASAHAKAWYAKLAGGSTGGTVVVKANIDRGTVLLDDDVKGNLASGTVTLSGVAEGRHTLAIEAKDHQRYATSITVHNGETLPHSATLVEMSKKPGSPTTPTGEPISRAGTVAAKPGSDIWKPVFYGTAAATVGAAGFSVFAITRSKDEAGQIMESSMTVTQKDCSGSVDGLSIGEQTHLTNACDWHRNQIIGWVVTGVVGAAVVGSFYMAFIRDRDHAETRTVGGGHRKRRELAITPVVTPDGGGATVRFDW
jgi:hypothetical protein